MSIEFFIEFIVMILIIILTILGIIVLFCKLPLLSIAFIYAAKFCYKIWKDNNEN
jgi:hypothetical protein